MALNPGQKLGPYEIIEAAGAGGMGEVYRAKDTRLDRIVAIKVMPSNLVANADLKQRFDREAKAISSLNHPNICVLFDVGHQDGIDFLVMEYLEGETLAQRLEKGPIPLGELLEVATEISDGLDKAHRQGMIHRDLKPGNIMLTKEGAKLLDFGLAKLTMPEGPVAAVSHATQTTPLTGQGTLIGTLQYMAPEQLEGQEADQRSDIFALGAVIYEMATGQKAFPGKSQASLIAAVLEKEPPPLSSANSMSPPGLDRLVRKCLAKDPDDRWQSVRDLGDELRWIQQSGSQAGIPLKVSVRRRLHLRTAWVATTVAALAALFFAYMWLSYEAPEKLVRRFSVDPGVGLTQVEWPSISPDGRMIAFSASDSTGRSRIFVRPLNSLDAYPLPGTEGAGRPFWSPDSKFLGFVAGRSQIKKIPVGGGPAQLIGEVPGAADGSWGAQNYILLDGGNTDSLRYISASGGTPSAATIKDSAAGEQVHAWPSFLPDGNHFLYTAGHTDGSNRLKVGAIDSDFDKTLTTVDSRIQFVQPGYVVYVLDKILLAHRFDVDNLELVGEPVPLSEAIGITTLGLANFSASFEGTLVFQHGISINNSVVLKIDRSGTIVDTIGAPAPYGDVQVSRNEDRLLYQLTDLETDTDDLWVRDLRRNVASRLTFDPLNDIWPIWSPDETMVYYASNQSGRFQIYRKPANGTGAAELVAAIDSGNSGPTDIYDDGTKILVNTLNGSWDIFSCDTESGEISPVISTPFSEFRTALHPSGRYLAYQSDESGTSQVYVRELTATGGKWQISTDGGGRPLWRDDGRELYYAVNTNDFMAVPIKTDGGFRVDLPQKLFSKVLNTTGLNGRRYDVSSDGQHFYLSTPLRAEGEAKFIVVLNWPTELALE